LPDVKVFGHVTLTNVPWSKDRLTGVVPVWKLPLPTKLFTETPDEGFEEAIVKVCVEPETGSVVALSVGETPDSPPEL